MYICRKCGQSKSYEAFPIRNGAIVTASCKECKSAARRARRASTRRSRPVSPVPTTTFRPVVGGDDFVIPADLSAVWDVVVAVASDGGLPPNLLFAGPSGSGKTRAAKALADRSGLDFVKVDAPAMVDPESWFGTREIVSRDGVPETVYHESEFVRAIGRPCVLLVDEVNRIPDAIRGILLPVFDDSRAVTNPISGETVVRHPGCIIVMTANIGLNFTGTYAVDPALMTRSIHTLFDYLPIDEETNLVVGRTGCEPSVASLFVRFATETRNRWRADEDFPPISTREVLTACGLVARGLAPRLAAYQAIINGASSEGGAESVRFALETIWTAISGRPAQETDV